MKAADIVKLREEVSESAGLKQNAWFTGKLCAINFMILGSLLECVRCRA